MKLHRFIGDYDLTAPTVEIRDSDAAHQMLNVLRLKIGDALILCDGNGYEALGAVIDAGKKRITIGLQEKRHAVPEPARRVTLYAAILRRENFELAVQKAVECGAHAIVPMTTQRTVKLGVNIPRLQTIAREAAELSGRGTVPVISDVHSFAQALEHASQNDVNLFFDAGGDEPAKILKRAKPASVGAFIGPEGGWTDEEAAITDHKTFAIAGLGEFTLRGETACAIATYLLCHTP